MSDTNHPESNITDPNSNLVVVSEVLPDIIPILPVFERPIFPGITLPFVFSGKEFVTSIQQAAESDAKVIGVVYVRQKNGEAPLESDFYPVGTVLKIYKVNQIADDSVQVVAQGITRLQKINQKQNSPLFWQVEYIYDSDAKPDEELKAYALAIVSSIKELLKVNPIFQEQLKMLLSQVSFEKPALLMDLISSMLTTEGSKIQKVLEAFDLKERAKILLLYLKEEKELFQLQEKIKKQIDEKISKQQREMMLREQLKAIKQELGIEKDDKSVKIEELAQKAETLKLSDEARKVFNEEMERLKLIEPASAEFNVILNYLRAITELPWGVFSDDITDIAAARQILEKEHYGLDDVKNRILEYISTIIKRGTIHGSNILLIGPPGVGKTSIGRSIAHALGRKFYRFSVGGMRDEAEIKGHRRTYVGAMPGKLIESLRRSQTANPVIMIDEIDKLARGMQGDPASALLEVLDPEQNHNFLDHYLDLRFDLSRVLFVATANQLDTIPPPLLDRLEVIRLSGYILEEKLNIAQKYLIPRNLEQHGLTEEEFKISKEALRFLIDKYAREAGVRNLENQIKKLMRMATLKQAEKQQQTFDLKPQDIEDFLGKPVFSTENLYPKPIAGVVLGLAYTALGGATLYIEASGLKSKTAGFKQTGQLGDVMRESSEIAYSFIRAHYPQLDEYFTSHQVHLHVPAGATPKDGPSAGITMALALYSLAANQPVTTGIAMTGELTLTGRVLPIGGVREKTIAARRVGIGQLILPGDNEKDFLELPDYIRDGIEVHYAEYFHDVIHICQVSD